MKFIRDLPSVEGKKVIVWTELDVPVENGTVVDNTRLKAAAKTLNYLREKGASILMLGHLGRPKGKEPSLSLRPVAISLGDILGVEVELLEQIKPPRSGLAMLENIRFWPAEEAKDPSFAQEIAKLGQIYVNDCFSTSHRAGSTMLYLPELLPSYAGMALEREVEELAKVIRSSQKPLVAIIGGAKIETKLPSIANLARVADKVLVGGRLMFEVGSMHLDNNVVVASDDIDTKDIGPKSIEIFSEIIKAAAMVVWNGPMGVFEEEKYASGTKAVAKVVTNSQAYSVVGGGDTIDALNKFGLLDKISYISVGGGAMLEFLAGKKLPGLEALEKEAHEQ
jgi:phosphoglycerate kinase